MEKTVRNNKLTPDYIMRLYDNRLNVTGYRDGLEEILKPLYEECYPNHKYSIESFAWSWEKNPCLQKRVVNVWDGDTLVAHETTTASFFIKNGNRVIWGLSGTTVAKETYPGMKILLSDGRKNLYENIENIIGFPNSKMRGISVRIPGNYNIGEIPFLYLENRKIRNNYPVNQIYKFSIRHSQLDLHIREMYRLVIEHTPEYLNWRFIEKPNSGYKVFEYQKNGFVEGYIVLNTYDNYGKIEGQIIDILALNDKAFEELVLFAIDYFYETGCKITKLWMTGDYHKNLLLNMNFKETDTAFTMMTTCKDIAVHNSYITMAISDVF